MGDAVERKEEAEGLDIPRAVTHRVGLGVYHLVLLLLHF